MLPMLDFNWSVIVDALFGIPQIAARAATPVHDLCANVIFSQLRNMQTCTQISYIYLGLVIVCCDGRRSSNLRDTDE